jgi:hypothetical protein
LLWSLLRDMRHEDGIRELGRDVAGEVESDWMVPLLVEEERDRLMAWQLGVSLELLNWINQ